MGRESPSSSRRVATMHSGAPLQTAQAEVGSGTLPGGGSGNPAGQPHPGPPLPLPAPVGQMRAMLAKRVYWLRKASCSTPVGPLRCFDTMTSAVPRSGDSAL
jgi:hypothetical protein